MNIINFSFSSPPVDLQILFFRCCSCAKRSLCEIYPVSSITRFSIYMFTTTIEIVLRLLSLEIDGWVVSVLMYARINP